MSVVCIPAVAEFPNGTTTPTKYGLFSVAKPFPELDDHWRSCGVQFQSESCPESQLWIQGCPESGSKSLGPDQSLLDFDPFTIYTSWNCGVLGKTPQEHMASAQRALLCIEETAVEEVFYSGTTADTPSLVGSGAIPINTTATPYSLASGIGALEGAMGAVQCGEPTIHAPRELGALAARFHQTFGSGGMLRTALGSPIAFGTGYGNTSPVGVAPPAGIAWLYATGPVYLAKSEIWMNPPTFEDALNRTNNELIWEANRTFVLGVDGCATFAVAVSTNGS